MINMDDFCGLGSHVITVPGKHNFTTGKNVMLFVLYHACKELNNGLKFMFVWHDMAYLSDNGITFYVFIV